MTYPKTLTINLTPNLNGGECISLTLTANEIGCISEEFSMNSYGNCASFTTYGIFTSDNLLRILKEIQVFEITTQEVK